MKSIYEYLSTKIVNPIDTYEFNSQITNNPHEFNGLNYIVGSQYWKKNRVAIFIEYVNEIIKENLLTNNEDISFAKSWLTQAKRAYNYDYSYFPIDLKIDNQSAAFRYLFNGKKPFFGYAKFTYDVLNYALKKPNLSVPREQKLNKMLRESYLNIADYKNEMNWY